jgi:sulfur relay (sulfurtransferase) complex TusBCD TusD component (DsrE family)
MGIARRSLLIGALALMVAVPVFSGVASAGANDPLFINLTSDESHRATMAIGFGGNQLKLGHPLSIFLNDRAVVIASTANAGTFAEQQAALKALVEKGANVIVCPMCMKHYGVAEADLLPGLKVGNPELTGGLLFQDSGKTLSW